MKKNSKKLKKKKTVKIWDVNVDNTIVLKLIETKTNFNYWLDI